MGWELTATIELFQLKNYKKPIYKTVKILYNIIREKNYDRD